MSALQTAQRPTCVSQLEKQKAEATLMAQFSLRGHAVHRATDSGYLVCKHGYVKHCTDLQALESFADQVGVPR